MNTTAPLSAAPAAALPIAQPGVRPLLFLHIPKTAGTSFVTTLQNLFGDRRVTRFVFEDPNLASRLKALENSDRNAISCINGHLPAYCFGANMFDTYDVFTILRHPVQRVMSLFRFLRGHTEAELAATGLKPGFGFDAFIENRTHDLYQQINNGMVRALCGDPSAISTSSKEFWNLANTPEFFSRAVGMLDRMDFGLAEQMNETQARLRARWGLPFNLPPMRLNTTSPGGEESKPDNIRRIVERNTLDIAFYEYAAARFAARPAEMATRQRPDTLFAPPMEASIPLADIPGRIGFYPFEKIGVAWIADLGPALIHLVPPQSELRLSFKIYTVAPGYPLDQIIVRVDGRRVRCSVQSEGTQWAQLTTDIVQVGHRMATIGIEVPYAIPVRFLSPNSPDKRALSIAVGSLRLLSA